MIDRERYKSKYAPDYESLIAAWNEAPPTSSCLESFFLNELCEEVDFYFVAQADVFLEFIQRQPFEDQVRSVGIIVDRLLIGLERSRLSGDSLSDGSLAEHYKNVMTHFGEQSHNWMLDPQLGNLGHTDRQRFIRNCLAIIAAANGDLSMAYLIRRCEHEMKCSNPDCDSLDAEEVCCPECGGYLIPIDFHNLRRER